MATWSTYYNSYSSHFSLACALSEMVMMTKEEAEVWLIRRGYEEMHNHLLVHGWCIEADFGRDINLDTCVKKLVTTQESRIELQQSGRVCAHLYQLEFVGEISERAVLREWYLLDANEDSERKEIQGNQSNAEDTHALQFDLKTVPIVRMPLKYIHGPCEPEEAGTLV